MPNKLDQRVEEFYMVNCHSVKTVPMFSTETAVGAIDHVRNLLTQTRQEALQEALELVGEDLPFKVSENMELREGYNTALAELREALQAKKDEV